MQISSPLFKTNGLEELAVGDVYKLTDSIPVNKVFEAAKDLSSKLYDSAGGREGLVNSVTRLIAAKKSGLSGKALLEEGLYALGTNKSSLIRESGGWLLDKASGFVDIDPEIINQVKIVGNDIEREAYGEDMFTMNSMFEVLGVLSNDDSYLKMVNVGMEASVWGATISQAVKYNIPEVVDYVGQSVDPAIMKLSMIFASSSVMSQGDLDALITTLTHLTPDEITGNNPDFIRYFLAAFRMGSTWTPDMYPAKSQLLRDTLIRLDPMWCTYKRQPEEIIISLAALSNMSADARILLSLDETLKGPIQIAPNYPATTSYSICQRLYPRSVASLK